MTGLKMISFEMKLEFEMLGTDYDMVWSLDNNETNAVDKVIIEEKIETSQSVQVEDNMDQDNDLILEGSDDNSVATEESENDAKEKQKVFGKNTDLFRESWGLLHSPPVLPESADAEDGLKMDSSTSEDD